MSRYEASTILQMGWCLQGLPGALSTGTRPTGLGGMRMNDSVASVCKIHRGELILEKVPGENLAFS